MEFPKEILKSVLAALLAERTVYYENDATEPAPEHIEDSIKTLTVLLESSGTEGDVEVLAASSQIDGVLASPSATMDTPKLDTERLDWLSANLDKMVFQIAGTWYTAAVRGLPAKRRTSLRDAIDSLRKIGI